MTNPVDKRLAVTYTPGIALRIAEEIASGKTLVEIADMPGMPSRNTIYRWLAVYPKFFDAFERAREVSAQSLEEEALLMARALKGQNDFTGTKVQAYNIAMQQLRWSASRRDKARYGQQVQATASVPIQINTTLNLDPTKVAVAGNDSPYTLEVTVEPRPAVTEGYDEDTVDAIIHDGTVEMLEADLTPTADEAEAETDTLPFGLPETEKQQLHNPPPGRPPKRRLPKRHKSEASAANTARRYAEAERKRLAKAAPATDGPATGTKETE